MSADRQRLTSAIRRIAKTDPEIRGLLEAADNKGGKPGAAGVGGGAGEGEESRICCDGSVNENFNPGTDERNPDDGGQDGLDPDDPANLDDNGPGELGGVTDCATGEPICFDGGGFIPPDGWDEPDEPPPDADWQEGYYWAYTLNDNFVPASTPDAAADKAVATVYPDGWYWSSRVKYSSTQYFYYLKAEDGGARGAFSILRRGCDGADAGEAYCTETPTADAWPSDSCVNLAVKSGTIVGSKYDPENDGSYSAPRDEIELCDPENGTRILVRPSSSGGWKSIKSLAGEPDGAVDNGYLYANDGKRIRQISPSEFRDDTV